jgi:hypothetical protein
MVPVGTINLFVGLASVSDPTEAHLGQQRDPYAPGELLTATLLLSGEAHTEGESALEDDADSVAATSVAGSIIAALLVDSITLVSNPGDYEDSILPLFESDSESDSIDISQYQYPMAILTVTGDEAPPPPDPFSTPPSGDCDRNRGQSTSGGPGGAEEERPHRMVEVPSRAGLS